jgi:dihydroorotate dehydrogenase electron transfer subunit
LNNNAPVTQISEVVSIRDVMPGVFLMWMLSPAIASAAHPGQFVMLRCGNHNFLRRPLSIHRVSGDRRQVAFLFAAVGKGTAWLAAVKPGERLDLLGPLGKGFEVDARASQLLLVAGGLGVAPLGFLADEARLSGRKVTLLLGAATAASLCPLELLPGVDTCLSATDDGTCGRRGFVTHLLAESLSDTQQVFACGPLPMLRALAADPALNQHRTQVSLEIRMACGLGVCYGCTINTVHGLRQVCKHGPVFEMADILWQELRDI